MAIQNDNKNKPSIEALISNAVDFVGETVGAVAERIDVLPHLDGDTLTSAKQDLHQLVGKLREARYALFSPSEIFEKKGITVDEFEIDTSADNPDNDCKFARLLHDVFNGRDGVEFPQDVHEYYSNGNGR